MSDGVELHCTEHPRGGFWLWLRNLFRRGPSRKSLETAEIEVPPAVQNTGKSIRAWSVCPVITPEMLEAGGTVVNECEHIPINDSYEVAARVYEAMVRAREEG